jgi:hypothetical protein
MLFRLYCSGLHYGGSSHPVQVHALKAWIKAAGAMSILARFLRVSVLAVLRRCLAVDHCHLQHS